MNQALPLHLSHRLSRRLPIWGLLAGLLLAACGHELHPTDPVLLPIRDKGAFGYINKVGEVVIPPSYAYCLPFSQHLGAVNIGGTGDGRHMPTNGKWGFVDVTGNLVINPQFFSPITRGAPYDLESAALALHEGYRFAEGLAAVRLENEWVYIDTLGHIVIRNTRIRSARRFSEGLANVYIGSRWGYIDRQGNVVITPRYLTPANFKDGLAMVENEQGQRIVINQQGEPPAYLSQHTFVGPFFEGHAIILPGRPGAPTDKDPRRHAVIDMRGRSPFNPDSFYFDRLGRYGSGYLPALVGSAVGDPVNHPQLIRPTEEPGGKWGFINPKGHFVVSPVYEDARGFSEGIGAVKQNGQWAYIGSNFGALTGHEFRWVGYFEREVAFVQLGPIHSDYDRRYAFINSSGEVFWIEPD
ncbi:MAG: WG repeat-containing protein [Bacteroidia bacterium]